MVSIFPKKSNYSFNNNNKQVHWGVQYFCSRTLRQDTQLVIDIILMLRGPNLRAFYDFATNSCFLWFFCSNPYERLSHRPSVSVGRLSLCKLVQFLVAVPFHSFIRTAETVTIAHLKMWQMLHTRDEIPQHICQGNIVLITIASFSAQTLAAMWILRNTSET